MLPSPSTATPLGADRPLCATTCQGPFVTTTAVGPATPGAGVMIWGAFDSRTFCGASAPKVGSATGVTPAAADGPGGGALARATISHAAAPMRNTSSTASVAANVGPGRFDV